MEESNDIFLAGGDYLACLAQPMHKNFLQHLFGAIHLVLTYFMTNFSTPLPQYLPVHFLNDLPSITPVA